VLVRHCWTIISRISPRVSPPVTNVSSARKEKRRLVTRRVWDAQGVQGERVFALTYSRVPSTQQV
jgi:hypothetical protein